MKSKFQKVKGTYDILPPESVKWNQLISSLQSLSKSFGFEEIKTPIIENLDLFKQNVGFETDVSKEMFSWEDSSNNYLALKPEMTAPVVRSYIQHNLGSNSLLQRLYYIGPSFRRERPQKGRQRQFHQFGVEAIGSNNPEQDAEVISLGWSILKSFGIDTIELKISSIGSHSCRANFKAELISYLNPFIRELSEISQRRLEKKPLTYS